MLYRPRGYIVRTCCARSAAKANDTALIGVFKPCGTRVNSKLLRHWQFEEYGWSKVPNLGLTSFRGVGLEARFAAESGRVLCGIPVT